MRMTLFLRMWDRYGIGMAKSWRALTIMKRMVRWSAPTTFHTMGNVFRTSLGEITGTNSFTKNNDFTGICFVNLVEFDSEYGHRRDPLGYGKCLEAFDKRLAELLEVLKEDDLVIVTADHGNDPTWAGTDHTREKVPLLMYSKKFNDGGYLDERSSFADIGATILENFHLKKPSNLIGQPIKELLK